MQWNSIESFGTLASIVVAFSLTMRNIKRLRILNLVGSACFTAYGVLIGATPVWLLNAFIVGIDAWFLWRMASTRDAFDTLEVDLSGSEYARLFLEHYGADLRRFEPSFSLEAAKDCTAEFILRDMVPVSLVIWRQLEAERIEIVLDYAAPSWRDYKNAEFWFGKVGARLAEGRRVVFVARTAVAAHARYLLRMGFSAGRLEPDGRQTYERAFKATR